MDNSDHCCSVL